MSRETETLLALTEKTRALLHDATSDLEQLIAELRRQLEDDHDEPEPR